MGNLDQLFADLLDGGERLPPSSSGESGDSGESQALARVPEHSTTGESVAKSGEPQSGASRNSPVFATRSPAPNHPESEQRRGSSPDSPLSPTRNRTSASPASDEVPYGWSDADLAVFIARRDRLIRWRYGKSEAERLAARLTVRDRELDDRRMCLECSALSETGRCNAAARMTDASNRLEPVNNILQRCHFFKLRKELK